MSMYNDVKQQSVNGNILHECLYRTNFRDFKQLTLVCDILCIIVFIWLVILFWLLVYVISVEYY